MNDKHDKLGLFAKKDGGSDGSKDTPAERKRLKELTGKVVKVDLNSEMQKRMDSASTHAERQQIAFRYIKDNLKGKYVAKDGREINITGKTAKKFTNKATSLKLKVTPELGNLIEHSELIKIVDGDKDKTKFEQFAYYEAEFAIGDDNYVGLLNVGIANNGIATLYDLRPYEQIKK